MSVTTALLAGRRDMEFLCFPTTAGIISLPIQHLHLQQPLSLLATVTLQLPAEVQQHRSQPGGNFVPSGTSAIRTAKGNFI